MTLTITLSWDDGHQLDQRIADMMSHYGLTGTFYIAREYVSPRLSESAIRTLSDQHEVGAHTLTHPILTQIDPAHAHQEIVGSRHWLQAVTGKPITAFCYPGGFYNQRVRQSVIDAGYTTARTVTQYALHPGHDPFSQATTLHLYPFPLRPLPEIPLYRGWSARLKPLRLALPHILRGTLSPGTLTGWSCLADDLLARAASQTNGIWHLWGHSWEVEKYNLWHDLETTLQRISHYDSISVTGSQLAQQISNESG